MCWDGPFGACLIRWLSCEDTFIKPYRNARRPLWLQRSAAREGEFDVNPNQLAKRESLSSEGAVGLSIRSAKIRVTAALQVRGLSNPQRLELLPG